ncbi:MAG: nodulation protein NfeD [Candidatus Heimdallarchaeota archaeon]
MSRRSALFIFLAILGVYAALPVMSQSNIVIRVVVDDEITDATAMIIEDAIESATREGRTAIILELNTPGGEVDATFQIMDAIENSPVPVIGYVAPIGANAFSAGTYILMATHVAAMAPGAAIGSGQPVTSTGELITDSKYINALINKMIGAARVHNRNETAARLFIEENLNLITEEAINSGVIEIAPSNFQDLLFQLETRILVKYSDNWQVYNDAEYDERNDPNALESWDFNGLSHATTQKFEPGLMIQILDLLSDPNLAYLLLLIGVWALILGLQTPGFGAEIVGSVSLVLGLVGVGVIGLSLASFLLFILGALLLILELKFHTAVLTAGGTLCLILGTLFIIPSNWILTQEALNSIRYGLFAITGTIAGIFSFAIYKASQVRRRPTMFSFKGKTGIAASDIDPEGKVKFEGALWKAELVRGNFIQKGDPVEIVGIEGLKLLVEPTRTKPLEGK